MKKLVIATIIVILGFHTLSTAEAQEVMQAQISKISVLGLKRTRARVPEKLLSRFLGTSVSDLDEEIVITILLETGIFEDIEVRTKQAEDSSADTGTTLEVTVSEKWSIIPLPVFVASSDGFTAGAGLIDANAFGLNDKIFAIGLLLPDGWMTSLAYVNVPDSERDLRWSVSGFFSSQDKTVVDQNEDSIRRYASDAARASFEIGFPLIRSTKYPLEASVGAFFNELGVREVHSPLAQPEAGRVVGLKTGLSLRGSSWDGVFLSERQASLSWSYNYGLLNDSHQSLNFRSSYDYAPFPGLRLSLRGAAVYAPETPAVFEDGPFSIGNTILPTDFSARNLAGFSAGFEGRIIKFPFGVLSGLLSYQVAFTDGPILGTGFDHGPAGGVRVYIAKVAIPALDAGAAYNVETGIFKATFGIGMRM